MLDESLPTFIYRQSPNQPLLSILYFTQNGNDPVPEYSLKRADPALPESKNKYAVALADTAGQDVIFAEVLIEPEWQQPTLSAAEIRAQGGVPPPPAPIIPDCFTIQLYNPDQQILVKGEKSTWTGKESWEFEVPQQSFRLPSNSKVDHEMAGPSASTIAPKILMRWARNSKFSKDITCYMTGRSVKGKKSKDPDITIAMVKQGREQALTIYEPNLNRVDVEDRKGFELMLLLSAEVIREIYLFPNPASFNLVGPPNQRINSSRPSKPVSASPKPNDYTMSGAVGNVPPGKNTTSPATAQPGPPGKSQAEIDAETQRLQKEMQREKEREREEREKRDRAEQKRIKKMLEEEERARHQQEEEEINKETERLRQQYGVTGQDLGPRPNLPPRPGGSSPGQSPHSPNPPQSRPNGPSFAPPPRPVSAEPRPHGGGGGLSSLFHKSKARSPGPQDSGKLQKK